MKDLLVYVNGEYLEKSKAVVSVFDHGLLYGDGIFEGIRAYNGNVFRLDEHVERLYDSAKYVSLAMPMTRHEMSEAILETLRKNHLKDAYIRVVVTRGTGDLGIDPALCRAPTMFIIAEPAQSSLAQKGPRVVKVVISSVRRDSVDATSHEAKSLNYLNSIMAKIEATGVGADDAILLDSRGLVSESSATNVFVVKDNRVFTPPPSAGVLHGITRARLIRLCSDLGLEVSEREVTVFELMTADEVFLCGTKSEMLAVSSVNGRKIGSGAVGPMTKRLAQEFGFLVMRREEGTPIYEAEVPL